MLHDIDKAAPAEIDHIGQAVIVGQFPEVGIGHVLDVSRR